MIHKFSYVKAGIWYRPIIPITLRSAGIEISYLALLDSGADFNILHGDIARILKIKHDPRKNPVKFSGIKQSASGVGYFTSVEVGISDKFKPTTVVFSDDISQNGYGILGQQGFFNNYSVTFDYKNKEITIENS